MKIKTVKRGLYRREIRTAETDDEQWDILRELAASLDEYVDSAREQAGNILRKNGIEPDSLFDVIKTPKGTSVRWAALDRDSLSPEVDYALEVVLRCQDVRDDLTRHASRDTLWRGIRLTQAIDRTNANIAWLEPVDKKRQHTLAAIENNEKRRKETKQTAENDWQPRCDELFRNNPNQSWHDIAIKVGSKFNQSYSTIKRHCKDPTKA